jgi:hypothetical protein
MIKFLPFNEQDFVTEFVQHHYPESIICYIYARDPSEESWKWIKELCKKFNIDYTEVIIHEHILLEFSKIDGAIDFCNSVPDSEPYCVVYERGQLVHENT